MAWGFLVRASVCVCMHVCPLSMHCEINLDPSMQSNAVTCYSLVYMHDLVLSCTTIYIAIPYISVCLVLTYIYIRTLKHKTLHVFPCYKEVASYNFMHVHHCIIMNYNTSLTMNDHK